MLTIWADPNKGTEQIESFVKAREENKGGLFEINSVKIFMDGVFAAGTAYLSVPLKKAKKLIWLF